MLELVIGMYKTAKFKNEGIQYLQRALSNIQEYEKQIFKKYFNKNFIKYILKTQESITSQILEQEEDDFDEDDSEEEKLQKYKTPPVTHIYERILVLQIFRY